MENEKLQLFEEQRIRTAWDEEKEEWYFSIVDVVGALNGEADYEKTRNYWKYLKAKLKRENNELVSVTTQLRFTVHRLEFGG